MNDFEIHNGVLIRYHGDAYYVNIPEGVTAIGDYAFYGCRITHIRIPRSVTSVGACAFYSCSFLETIELSESMSVIEWGTFADCPNLYHLTIPDNIRIIREKAFAGCTHLQDLVVPDSFEHIGDYAFWNCPHLHMHQHHETLTIPEGTEILGDDQAYVQEAEEEQLQQEEDPSVEDLYNSMDWCETMQEILSDMPGMYQNCTELERVVIPEGVRIIGTRIFKGCKNLKEVILPHTLEYISEEAFADCTSLISITIPEGVKSLKAGAFAGCFRLEQITLPASLISMEEYGFANQVLSDYGCYGRGWYVQEEQQEIYLSLVPERRVFEDCPNLKDIRIDKQNPVYSSIDGVIYNADRTNILYCPTWKTELILPDSVTRIESSAFQDCPELTRITLPRNLRYIDSYAFENCPCLQSVNVTAQPTDAPYNGVIRSHAFANCPNLTEITIPEGFVCIERQAFLKCHALTSVNLPNSLTILESYTFDQCTSLSGITLPKSLQYIGSSAFRGCIRLKTVSVSDTENTNPVLIGYNHNPDCREMGNYAFDGCSALISITIPNGITAIRYHAFYGCSSLKQVTLPDSVLSIDEGAFEDCFALTDIRFPEKMNSIGKRAFAGCSGLLSLTLPKQIDSIDDQAFAWCSHLHSITFPEFPSDDPYHYIRLGSKIFQDCTGLTSITIPEGCTFLANWIFAGCTGLTDIRFPESLGYINQGAFSNCISLKELTLPQNVTTIGEHAFRECSGLTKITIPNNLRSIQNYAFKDCTSLQYVELYGEAAPLEPKSFPRIYEDAFLQCTNLLSISIPEHIVSIEGTVKAAYSSRYTYTTTFIRQCGNPMEIRYRGYTFPASVTNKLDDAILKMIREKDFSDTENHAAKTLILWYMYLSAPDQQDITAYIREHTGNLFRILIEQQNLDIIQQILDSADFLTKENIDPLIQYAIEQKAHEIQIMLTNHKAQKIGYDDIETTIQKKFDL